MRISDWISDVCSSDLIETHRPKFVLDASGFGRTLPRLLGLERPSDVPSRTAVYTQVRDNIRPGAFDRQKIRVTIHPKHHDVWYWLIPFTKGISSMGIVATAEFIASYKGTPEEKLWQLVREDEALAELLKDAEPSRPVQLGTESGENR